MQCFLCHFQFRPTCKLIMCKHCIVWSIAWAAGPNRIEETVSMQVWFLCIVISTLVKMPPHVPQGRDRPSRSGRRLHTSALTLATFFPSEKVKEVAVCPGHETTAPRQASSSSSHRSGRQLPLLTTQAPVLSRELRSRLQIEEQKFRYLGYNT